MNPLPMPPAPIPFHQNESNPFTLSQVVTVILPVFALITLGYLMVKRRLFSKNGVDDLTGFIFYLAVPALLFRTSASGVMAQPLEPGILLAYYGVALTLFFTTFFILRKTGHEKAVVSATGSSFSNLALIGLPIVQTAFGPEALVPLMTLISVNAMILFTLPCVMIQTARNPHAKTLDTIKSGFLSLVTNPLIIALTSGWAYAQTGLDLPVVVDRITQLLGQAAAPCALFAVGGGMARHSLTLGETTIPVLLITLCKLLLMPMGVWLCCTYLIEASPLWTMIATLGAAMPSGANVFILATRYQTSDRIAGNAILLTTAFSLFSISAFLIFFPAP